MDALYAITIISALCSFVVGASCESLLRPRSSAFERIGAGVWCSIIGMGLVLLVSLPFL